MKATLIVIGVVVVIVATILWMFANYSMKFITGMFFLKRVSKDLFQPTPEVTEELAERQAAHMGGNI